ncbi:hypothetical protein, partial [Paracoccus nototheniae]
LQLKEHVEQLKTENKELKERHKELELQLSTALTEIAGYEVKVKDLKDKLAIYETAKDTDGDGKVSYDEMTADELRALLDQRKVEYKARDSKSDLVQKAQDSE